MLPLAVRILTYNDIGGSGGTDGIYRLSGNLVQKLPTTKDVQASKAVKAYINKNKKILKNAIENDIYFHNPRKYSTLSKSSKGNKDGKEHAGSYSVSKDKIAKAYKETSMPHSNYTSDPIKGHKRSSSDSQKLYDLNKWGGFNSSLNNTNKK